MTAPPAAGSAAGDSTLGKRQRPGPGASPASPESAKPAAKRAKHSQALVVSESTDGQLIEASNAPRRTSNLPEPAIVLSGHAGHVYAAEFSPDGRRLVSTGFDKTLYLWDAFSQKNLHVFRGHQHAVLDARWSADGGSLFSASVDGVVAHWDVDSGRRVRQMKAHTSHVNSCAASRRGTQVVVSGSDDHQMLVWDPRWKRPSAAMDCEYAVTAVEISDDRTLAFAGGLDNAVRVFDVRKPAEPLYLLENHLHTVSGLRLSPDGGLLLSYGFDSRLNVWDVKPWVEPGKGRLVKTISGGAASQDNLLLRCSWSPDGARVACGSADQSVYMFDYVTGAALAAFPGHKGTVTSAVFHPNEPILASCSTDRTVILGEF